MERVCADCDNQAVVDMLISRTCKDRDLMQLLRIRYFFEAAHQFQLSECTLLEWIMVLLMIYLGIS